MASAFFFAVGCAVLVAVWCMDPSIGDRSRGRNNPPNFKPGAVDPHSTPKGGR